MPTLKRLLPSVAALTMCTLAAQCGSGGTAGPCYVKYADPLFTISAATSASSRSAIARIVVRNFSYNGEPRTNLGADFLTNHLGLTPRNAVVQGNEVVCDIVCAFGGPEGRYTLTLGAPGYRDTTFTVDAKFERGVGDCPTTLSGGETLSVTLSPAQ